MPSKSSNYLENMVVLTSPGDKAKLLLYIAASNNAVSAALVEEKEEDRKLKQVHVYFVSEALAGAKKFYSELEKMAYAVVMAARKLKHYASVVVRFRCSLVARGSTAVFLNKPETFIYAN